MDWGRLEIAGVPLVAEGPELARLDRLEPCYAPFASANADPKRGISFDIKLGDAAPPPGDPIFDTSRAWAVYADGDAYHLQFRRALQGALPLYSATTGRDVREVELVCSDLVVGEVEGAPALPHLVRYPLDQIILMLHLAEQGGFIVHGCGASFSGTGVLFPGRSGAGKTTISRILATRSDIDILSDDRIIVRKEGSSWFGHGTPWPGEGGFAKNAQMPLQKLVFLKHGDREELKPLQRFQAFQRLAAVVSVPWFDRRKVENILGVLDQLLCDVELFELTFRPVPLVASRLVEWLAR